MPLFYLPALFLLFSFSTLQELQTYETDEFFISYPESWTLDENGSKAARFVITSELENEDDDFAENINLVEEILQSSDITLEYYGEAVKGQVKKHIKGAKIIESKVLTGLNGKYFLIVYTAEMMGHKLKWKQQAYIKDSKAYVLTFTAKENTFDKFLPDANTMFSSFKLQ